MKTALITGVTGQDGAYLAQLLLKKKYRVFGTFRRTSTPNFWRLNFLKILDKINLIPCDILDYSSTSKYKTTRSLGGWSDNTAGQPQLNSALWLNANAISSITIGVGGGTVMTVNSIFSLYGIRGA